MQTLAPLNTRSYIWALSELCQLSVSCWTRSSSLRNSFKINTFNIYHYGLLPPLCYSLHVCVEQIQSLGKDHYFHLISHYHLLLLSHFSHGCLLLPLYLLVCLLCVLSEKRHLQRENAPNVNAIFNKNIMYTVSETCTHLGLILSHNFLQIGEGWTTTNGLFLFFSWKWWCAGWAGFLNWKLCQDFFFPSFGYIKKFIPLYEAKSNRACSRQIFLLWFVVWTNTSNNKKEGGRICRGFKGRLLFACHKHVTHWKWENNNFYTFSHSIELIAVNINRKLMSSHWKWYQISILYFSLWITGLLSKDHISLRALQT